MAGSALRTRISRIHTNSGFEKTPIMNLPELIEAIMALPAEERLGLARRIIASLPDDGVVLDRIGRAVLGIEDVITGKVAGLNEAEFRAAME